MTRETTLFLAFAFLAALGSVPSAPAAIISMDLRSTGAAGADLESTGAHMAGGITVDATAGGGIINATSERMGVNAPATGTLGDETDEIEAAFGESLTFTFTFGLPNVLLTEIDFSLVGTADDSALVSINGGTAIELHTGVADFNGTTDRWTPAGGIVLASGDTFAFTADISIALQAITLSTPNENNADFDSDGDVDGADFLIWQRGFATGATLAEGDANGSGTVDGDDLAIWKAMFGTSPAPIVEHFSSIQTVPEPATAPLLMLGAASILFFNQRNLRRILLCFLILQR